MASVPRYWTTAIHDTIAGAEKSKPDRLAQVGIAEPAETEFDQVIRRCLLTQRGEQRCAGLAGKVERELVGYQQRGAASR
jgi:hypothetical protein